MSTTVAITVAPFPAPATLEQTGLAPDQIEMLMVKILYGGEATGLGVADRMRLPFPIIEPLLERARAERLIEVKGMAGSGTASYRYALTDLGRDRAQQYLATSH
jgi:DNA-binding PadR family transcriptional regulator